VTRFSVLGAVLVCVLVGLAGCSSSKQVKVGTTPLPPTDLRREKHVDVDARSDQFSPAGIIVTVGTEVTWHNQDAVVHNVKKSADALDFGAPFGDNSLNPGQTYSFTFAKVGTFTYTCTIHAGMDGKVQVVAR
jgi:plastocyanin